MNLRQKVVSGIKWGTGAKLSGQLVSWVCTIIVIRLLTPEDYGLMALASAFVSFLILFNELGLGAALIQRQDLDETTLRKAFGLLFLFNLFLLCITFAAAPLVGWFFDEPRLIPLIRVLALQFLVMGFSIIPKSILTRSMDFRKLWIVDVISVVFGSFSTLLLAWKGWGVWSLVWGSLVTISCKTLGFNIVAPFLRFPIFSIRGMRDILSFSGYVAGERFFWFFYMRADSLIIGKLLGNEILGLYSVAKGLAALPMNHFIGLINSVAFPAFSSIQTDPPKAGMHFLKAVRLMGLIAFPALWGLSCIAPELFAVLLGAKWILGAEPFRFLCLAVPFLMISSMMSYAVLGMGRPKIHFAITFVAALVMPAAILISVRWGLIGVSLAWAVIYPLIFLFNLFQVVRVFGLRVRNALKAMARTVFATIVMYGAVSGISFLLTSAATVSQLLLLIVIGILAYGGLVTTFYRDGCYEALSLVQKRSIEKETV